ncbi:hypothetical protein [Rhizocola hellebori]|uniref:hypothetical protein n=1 Tax=Rhizocola hellebori TaxID=1392758 RepID=UPI0019441041|nr:hypothetical protein [Rhizocola hellebori]
MTSAERFHYMFTWPCGCPFSIASQTIADEAMWLETFDTAAGVTAAKAAGVKMLRITHDQWESEHLARFKARCEHNPPKLPPTDEPKLKDLDEDIIEMVVGDRVSDAINAHLVKLDQNQDILVARLGHLLKAESPFDVRAAIDEMVQAFSDVMEVR